MRKRPTLPQAPGSRAMTKGLTAPAVVASGVLPGHRGGLFNEVKTRSREHDHAAFVSPIRKVRSMSVSTIEGAGAPLLRTGL
jgi:hypothetical protein